MTSTLDEQKAAAIGRARALAASRLAEGESAAARDEALAFIAAFYEHAPPADIAARTPEDLAGAALALWQFAARRRAGEAHVRVYNPTEARDGWSSPHTIVEMVNDDMPFLVDSASAAINDRGRAVYLVIHPIVAVARDAEGNRLRFGAPDGIRESWMQIEIGRERSAAARAALAEALTAVLGDVRAAVEDWPRMRQAVAALSAHVAAAAPALLPAELDEGAAFLRWLAENNFTLLGMRDYDFAGGVAQPPLGVLREPGHRAFGGLRDPAALPPAVREFMHRRELLILGKTDRRSTVHRSAPMDAIGVRRFDARGEVAGLSLVVGLFTSAAYNYPPRQIPIVRRKIARVLDRSGLGATAHDGKALIHILDTFPRDELFQASEDWLYDTAIGVLNLQERQRIALFVRRDPLERFVSCLVYVPRERYDTPLRRAFAAILAEAFDGTLSAYYTHLDDSPLARLHFIIRTPPAVPGDAPPPVDLAALEARLAEAGRLWIDRVEAAAEAAFGEGEAHRRLSGLGLFPVDYQARTSPAQAIADLARIEAVLAGSPLEASLHPRDGEAMPGLRLYRRDSPVVLSDILPILENLGLRIVAEEPYRIDSAAGEAVWVHEFTLADGAVAAPLTDARRADFEQALVQIAAGTIENDGFNRLVLGSGLSARQTTILRLYCKVLRQAGSTFSQAYMEDTLAAHAEVARRLVRLFEQRFDPSPPRRGALDIAAELKAIEELLDAVESLDEDRILRAFRLLVLKSVRTNYFQTLPDGGAKPYLAVKLASSEIELLPLPRPLFEIYVYSPRTEGVHMRAGKVARGGIRWSDRREDFRTEILGLMKAQTVKNAVIIPVGSKGGFVLKRPPSDRAELQAEGIECYKVLMHGLLDLTDNIVADSPETHHIEPPPDVVRHDPDDPYLVVAADKGTATFSDTANAIAIEYGFWLGDAFASGGSAGYDHKAIGITSRGAWELVKRHFRELGTDIQASDFTVVAVGDMAGDVFGNAMLQSRHTRLIGAFNHQHIFIDPEPDAAKSYVERQRLFELPRSSWADYNKRLISPGGGVFERAAKSIEIAPEMKRVFAIGEDALTPAELIHRLLTAQVDLLFFGGIGTFVKARAETHVQAGDKANDALRIDGEDIRARVVGEGANLGVTEKGRIAYALGGGRIDTDAIDNSAGVSMSDHEVNIKILLGHAIATGALAAAEREQLLAAMTDEVAGLVLCDNYLQGEALSVAAARGGAALDRQARLMRALEKAGRLDRALEFLPDEAELAARATARRGLTRPELAVLLAYAKMSLDEELLASDLPDAPELAAELAGYFPAPLRERFAAQIAAHPLRREIVATIVANDVVNRAGFTFVHDLAAQTGAAAADTARAWRIVRDSYRLPALWTAIETLDNHVPAATQYEMLLDIAGIVEHAALWLLRAGRLDMAAETARFAPAVEHLAGTLAALLPADERVLHDRRVARLVDAGVPEPVAARVGGIVFLTTAFEVGDLAQRTGQPIDRAARVFYGVGARFALDGLRDAARRLPAETVWQKAAVEALIDDFYALQAEIAERVLTIADGAADPVAAWIAARAAQLAPLEALAADLRAAAGPDLAMLVVAGRQLRHAVGQGPEG
ncbi:MAG TPA: NAD-glutamate dehydrogenase domain-containing protein [Stellaceae bacterium]|nr:NAD-glutamate dehydrogenase domain-containing protein [Stellaceae bacterium]